MFWKEFEQFLSSISLVFVKLRKMLMVLCVMGVWLLAVNHCILERLPGLAFLQCEGDKAGKPDCADDSCATVEKATYKTESGKIAISAPSVLLANIFAAPVQAEQDNFDFAGGTPATAPELPATWQFSYRTAAPPRAPSVIS